MAARDSLVMAIQDDEPDLMETELATKRRLVQERTNPKTYKVVLPLAKPKTGTALLSLGFTLCRIHKGRVLGDDELHLDSLTILEYTGNDIHEGTIERIDPNIISQTMDGEFEGIIVASVKKDSIAYQSGIRPGHRVVATSATVGGRLWPKSTLEGIRSAVSSRRVAAGTIQFELQRPSELIYNQFELTLTRPIGLELKGMWWYLAKKPSSHSFCVHSLSHFLSRYCYCYWL